MYLNSIFLQHTLSDCPGCFWSWFIWMLAAFALGLGLGRWIWGKYKISAQKHIQKIKELKAKQEGLEKDFVAVKYQLNESDKDNQGLKASLAESEANIAALSTQLSKLRAENRATKTVDRIASIPSKIESMDEVDSTDVKYPSSESTVEEKSPTEAETSSITSAPIVETQDTVQGSTKINNTKFIDYSPYLKDTDLKIIEGVGPKIEGILNKAGFVTWKDLAEADANTLKNIMHDAGPRYRIHSPNTWQKQIKLCLEKNWQGLIDFQQKLYADKTNQDITSVFTKVEKIVSKKLGFVDIELNNLKLVEGIGPQIESLLKSGQINTLQDLATTPLERIEKILEDGGDNYNLAVPNSWSTQAQYALNHDWVKLRQYQDELT